MKGGSINVFQGIGIIILIATTITVIVLWQKGMFNKKQDPSSQHMVGPGGEQKEARPEIYN